MEKQENEKLQVDYDNESLSPKYMDQQKNFLMNFIFKAKITHSAKVINVCFYWNQQKLIVYGDPTTGRLGQEYTLLSKGDTLAFGQAFLIFKNTKLFLTYSESHGECW